MLSITKLGIEVLSRLAKQQELNCSCIYRGYYNPDGGMPYLWHPVGIKKTIVPANGFWCHDCEVQVEYAIYGWSWQEGLHEAHFYQTQTVAEIITDLLIKIPHLSHLSLMEKHKDDKILWVYRYDSSRL